MIECRELSASINTANRICSSFVTPSGYAPSARVARTHAYVISIVGYDGVRSSRRLSPVDVCVDP